MHVKWNICFSAMKALVAVTEQYVFTNVPEPHLFSLLILCALDIRVLQFLYIECSALNNNAGDWQNAMYKRYTVKVAVHFVLDRWCQPSVRPSAVIEPRSAVPSLSSPAAASCFTSRGQSIYDICAKFHICRK